MHEHHRERMRAKCLKFGCETFDAHEILEIILYYAIPRGDTNPTGHRLIQTFGSFRGVLSTPKEKLMEVEGIGEKSAELIRLFAEGIRRYDRQVREAAETPHSKASATGGMQRYFEDPTHEPVALFLFGARMELLRIEPISDAEYHDSGTLIDKVIRRAVETKAARIVLAQRRAESALIPTEYDYVITQRLDEVSSMAEIPLADHIILTENRYLSVAKRRLSLSDVRAPAPQFDE